ncbi:MAG: Crp/Fnr family transcriptional regulator [Paludibacteraceae bacterium]|nr:Crp/Fnr family transcriptional regulator [Paludibacteraceae bacterium]
MTRKQEPLLKSIEEVSDLWKVLTPEQLAYLKANYEVQKYKKNQIVYCEGDTPTHVLCLVSGKVKIFKTGVGGRSQIVRMVKPGETFAYRAMFAEEDFVTGASAFEPSIIYAIPKEVIKKLISQNSQLAWYFIHALSVDLGIADSRAVSLTQKHIRGRLAESLVFLRDNYGVEEDGATLSIYLSREDLASLSNMTTSNAIRTLSNFVTEHIIALDGRKIKIIDEEMLRKISKIG